jgi:exosortase sorting signal-containing protein
MSIYYRLYLSLVLITVLAFMPLWSIGNAQDADQGESANDLFVENVDPINEMTVTNVLFEFDELPQGPTSIEDILNAFPFSCLRELTFTPKSPVFIIPGSGIYNFQTGGGRALSLNPDGSGGLYLVDPLGFYGPNDSLIIDLTAPVRQFGFEIGDFGGTFNAEIFRDGTSVGIIQVETSNNRTHVFESTIPFDQVVLSVFDNPLGDFVVPSLRIPICQFARPIPTLSEWGLIAMAAILGIAGFMVMRRRKVTT